MGKKRKDNRQASVQFVPPVAIAPYVGQWINTSVPSIGPVVAYVINYNPGTGMVDMYIYRPGSTKREYMQFHYSDLVGIGPYYGPIPPYQQTTPSYPYPAYPPSPAPYPPYSPYPPYPTPRRSCRNYTNKSQQLACLMGLLPPI